MSQSMVTDATGQTGIVGNDDDDAPPPRKRLRGRARIVLVAALIAGIAAAAIWYIDYRNHGRFQQETNDARVQADMVTVSPRVAGYVAEVLVSDNQDVEAGQPLVRIDQRTAQAQASQADAQIAVAAAQADQARAAIDQQYATIDQSHAQLDAARAKAAYDTGEVARFRPLVATGAESRQQLARLEMSALQSAQDVRAQAAALQAQRRRIAALRSQVRQGEAQAQAGRAQRSSADVDVSAALVRAAIAGRVGDKTVTVGQYVQAGTRMMSIVPLQRIYVTANFKETQLALMRPGQPVSIAVDALDGIELKGRVESIAPGTGAQFSLLPPQNATGNFTKITQRVPVRISLEANSAARRLLVPGLSVTATVDTTGARQVAEQVRNQQAAADRRERSR